MSLNERSNGYAVIFNKRLNRHYERSVAISLGYSPHAEAIVTHIIHYYLAVNSSKSTGLA